MLLRLTVLLLAGIVFSSYSSSQRIRVRRQNMKVQINATEDTIVLKFVRPRADVKLEGYILGYGSTMLSKQFIQLPENGEPYEAEMDAEPKYLVAVQPIPTNDAKKHCTGHVEVEKPLHLVIGTVTPTTVLLSWRGMLTVPYESNIMDDCVEDGHYTVRYRERSQKWNYQTCPTTDTVIDKLKPDTQYEFGVQSNKDDKSGEWSDPVVHNTTISAKSIEKSYKPKLLSGRPGWKTTKEAPRVSRVNGVAEKPIMAGPQAVFPPKPVIHNKNQTRLPPTVRRIHLPGVSRTLSGSANTVINVPSKPRDSPPALPQMLPIRPSPTSAVPVPFPPSKSQKPQSGISKKKTNAPQRSHKPLVDSRPQNGQPQTPPALQRVAPNYSTNGKIISKNSTSSMVPVPQGSAVLSQPKRNPTNPPRGIFLPRPNNRRQLSPPRVTNASQIQRTREVNGERHSGPPYSKTMKPKLPQAPRLKTPKSRKPNLVGKPGTKNKADVLKETDTRSILKPKEFPVTGKPVKERKQSTTSAPTFNASQFDMRDNSSMFSSLPASEVDAMGKKRFVASHVIYQLGKKPNEPCSITNSLSHFPEEDWGEMNVTGPPRIPPSNLTVLTVEGCPSFVILDWDKGDNETTEFEVISKAKGPDGERVSVHTTNQTHTAVENLKPHSSYEFKVKPRNELGEGPATEPVSFVTESADPQVSDSLSGKNAIWTQYPFNSDMFSDCNGKQYIKRTWYRKFVGIQLCNSLRYKIYLSDSLSGKFYNIGDQTGHGEDHCQFVDSFLDGRTGNQVYADQLPPRAGYYRAVRQQPVSFGEIGGNSHSTYVSWYECGVPIPGKW